MVALANWLISPKYAPIGELSMPHGGILVIMQRCWLEDMILWLLLDRCEFCMIEDITAEHESKFHLQLTLGWYTYYLEVQWTMRWTDTSASSTLTLRSMCLTPQVGKGGSWDMVERVGPGQPELLAAVITEFCLNFGLRLLQSSGTEFWERCVSFRKSRNHFFSSGQSLSIDMGSGWPGDAACPHKSDSWPRNQIVTNCVFMHFLLCLIGDLIWPDQDQDLLQSSTPTGRWRKMGMIFWDLEMVRP